MARFLKGKGNTEISLTFFLFLGGAPSLMVFEEVSEMAGDGNGWRTTRWFRRIAF